MAVNAQAKLFDYAITFEQVKASGTVKQKNLDMQLKYTIHMFTMTMIRGDNINLHKLSIQKLRKMVIPLCILET